MQKIFSMRLSAKLLAVLCAVFCVNEVGAISDPTRPSGYTTQPGAAAKGEALRLESVLIAQDRRVAVISGRTYRVGDSVDGARLVAIHADGAELSRDGARIVLPLLKVKVRKYAP